MKHFLLLAGALGTVSAFPRFMDNPEALEEARALIKRQDSLGISQAETNCGPTPCTTFDAEDQLVSVTGEYAYASPGAGDIRGPCPGLNAASNHGYLPRNG